MPSPRARGVVSGEYVAEYSNSLSNLVTPFVSREGSPLASPLPSRAQVGSPVPARSPRSSRLMETITLPASRPFSSLFDERSLSETNLERGGRGLSGGRERPVESRATQTIVTTDRSTNTQSSAPAPAPTPRASRAATANTAASGKKSSGDEEQAVPNLNSDDIEHWLQFIHSNAESFNNTAP